jgi:hypothetical protein
MAQLIRRLLPPTKRSRFGKFGSVPKTIRPGYEEPIDLKQFTQERGIITRRRGVSYTEFPQQELEKRAVKDEPPHRGSVQERIVYLQCIKDGMVPDVDFSYQPAIEGGRQELGGLVVDFIFPHLGGPEGMALFVNGTMWHVGSAVEARDALTQDLLRGMGFFIEEVWDYEIADRDTFEDWWDRFIRHARIGFGG